MDYFIYICHMKKKRSKVSILFSAACCVVGIISLMVAYHAFKAHNMELAAHAAIVGVIAMGSFLSIETYINIDL